MTFHTFKNRWPVLILLTAGSLHAAASTDLVQAAKVGDTATVRALLAQGADPKVADVDGTTALHWVVRVGDVQTATLLIGRGASANAVDRYGVSPIHLASINGDADAIKLLLDVGVNADSANPDGETALMTASRTGSVPAMKMLLDHGASINAREKVRGQTALMWAVSEDHPDAVRFLIERGADVNARSSVYTPPPVPIQRVGQGAGVGLTRQKAPSVPQGMMTPLLYATRDGNLEMVKQLLASGADIKLSDANGTSPILFALVNGYVDLAKFLLEKGADLNATDGFGRAALFAAVDLRNAGFYSPRTGRDKADSIDFIRELLEHGAKPNVKTTTVTPNRGWQQTDGSWVNFTGQTPFLRAAFAGDVVVMRLLLSFGADPNIPTDEGTTPLMAAAGINYVVARTFTHSKADSLAAVKLCVEQGADINAKNSLGLAAIHGAANRGSDDILEFLAEKGAMLDVKDNEGRTPLIFAEGVFLAVNPPTPKPSTIALIRRLLTEHPVDGQRRASANNIP